jgi:LemA protein
MSLNTALQTFPNNVLAGMFGFQQKDYFEIEVAAKEAPKVSFS